MATRDVFSDDELAQLRRFAEPARAELIRYFTLALADETFVRKFRGRDNMLGAAVQLCTMPHWPTTFEGLAGAPRQPGSWKLPPHWRPPRENGGCFCLVSSM